jgi:hypothetical protein
LEFNHQAAVVGIGADSRHVGLDGQGQLGFGHSALAQQDRSVGEGEFHFRLMLDAGSALVAARRSADQRHVQRHPDRHLNLPAVHRLPEMDGQIISISISFQFNQI